QLQHLPQHLGQLVEGDLDLQPVLARIGACLAGAALALADAAGLQHVPGVAVAHAGAAGVPMVEHEVGEIDGGHRDGDGVLALLADHLPLGDVSLQVLLDLAPDDLPEAGVVLFDLQRHLSFTVSPDHAASHTATVARASATRSLGATGSPRAMTCSIR